MLQHLKLKSITFFFKHDALPSGPIGHGCCQSTVYHNDGAQISVRGSYFRGEERTRQVQKKHISPLRIFIRNSSNSWHHFEASVLNTPKIGQGRREYIRNTRPTSSRDDGAGTRETFHNKVLHHPVATKCNAPKRFIAHTSPGSECFA